VTFDSRAELQRLTVSLFSDFDYFVSPAHERTQWAIGLGLPMFVIGPDIGPFAPLNRRLLLEHGVAEQLPLEAAFAFGDTLAQRRLNRGFLEGLEQGQERYPLRGFEKAARHLLSNS
jgi:hypothetical protein